MRDPACKHLMILLGFALIGTVWGAPQLHGKLTPWDVEGMYAQAHAILEDKTIQSVSGVPAMLEACSRTGHIPAQRLLLDVYEGRFKGLEAQPQKALQLAYKLATETSGSEETAEEQAMRKEAAFRYALFCEHGYGCTKDPIKAYQWMRKLAMGGMYKAQAEVARYLFSGIGHEKAPRLALHLLWECHIKAPDTPNLYYYLGHMCSQGLGLRRPNQLMAYTFFKQGAARNDARATNNLAAMYERGIYVQADSSVAIRLYKYAAELGSKEASANVQRLAFKTNLETAIRATSASRRVCNAFLRLIDELPLSKRIKTRLSAPLMESHTLPMLQDE